MKLAGDTTTRTIAELFRSPALCEALTKITDEMRNVAEGREHHLKIIHFVTPRVSGHDALLLVLHARCRTRRTGALRYRRRVPGGPGRAGKHRRTGAARRADRFRELSVLSDKVGVMLRRRLAKLAQGEAARREPVAIG